MHNDINADVMHGTRLMDMAIAIK